MSTVYNVMTVNKCNDTIKHFYTRVAPRDRVFCLLNTHIHIRVVSVGGKAHRNVDVADDNVMLIAE